MLSALEQQGVSTDRKAKAIADVDKDERNGHWSNILNVLAPDDVKQPKTENICTQRSRDIGPRNLNLLHSSNKSSQSTSQENVENSDDGKKRFAT